MVEIGDTLSGELQMLTLVFADRYVSRPVKE
jgi:hypothetical protein